jgi:hypothetical protein
MLNYFFSSHPFCPGWKYFKCKQSEPLFVKLRTKVLPKAEANGQPNEAASNVHGREKRANSGDNGEPKIIKIASNNYNKLHS